MVATPIPVPFPMFPTVFALPGVPPILGGGIQIVASRAAAFALLATTGQPSAFPTPLGNAVVPAATDFGSNQTDATAYNAQTGNPASYDAADGSRQTVFNESAPAADTLPNNPVGNPFPATASNLSTSDSVATGNLIGGNRWGIFTQGGASIIPNDSVFSVEYVRDWKVADYKMEGGAFASYNKVELPYQAKVSYLVGKSRAAALAAVEAAVKSLDLVTVVMPEITYQSANLVHYGYRREARGGVSLLRIDVWAEEVRVIASAGLSNSKGVNGQDSTQSGAVQANDTLQSGPFGSPVTPDPAQSNSPPGDTPLVPVDERSLGRGVETANDRLQSGPFDATSQPEAPGGQPLPEPTTGNGLDPAF